MSDSNDDKQRYADDDIEEVVKNLARKDKERYEREQSEKFLLKRARSRKRKKQIANIFRAIGSMFCSMFRAILRALKYIICKPIEILSKMLSMIFKIGGYILTVGLPYGIYCVYKVVVSCKDGHSLTDVPQTPFALLFFIGPFVAFALAYIFEQIADYLELKLY